MNCWIFGHYFETRWCSTSMNEPSMLIIDYLYCVKCGKITNEVLDKEQG